MRARLPPVTLPPQPGFSFPRCSVYVHRIAASIPDEFERELFIALGILLMALNALAMIVGPLIMRRTGSSPLKLLGAVFGIFKLALGVQMLRWGITNGVKTV
jgi:small neutral amino acid transporter SnatA (MarC family)